VAVVSEAAVLAVDYQVAAEQQADGKLILLLLAPYPPKWVYFEHIFIKKFESE
jgi:hypothetical protein